MKEEATEGSIHTVINRATVEAASPTIGLFANLSKSSPSVSDSGQSPPTSGRKIPAPSVFRPIQSWHADCVVKPVEG